MIGYKRFTILAKRLKDKKVPEENQSKYYTRQYEMFKCALDCKLPCIPIPAHLLRALEQFKPTPFWL